MIARARVLAVLAIVLGGAIAIVSSTQTWLEVTLRAGATEPLPVSGAAAMPLLAPLSLAALALGLALTVVGRVLRYAFGILALVIGAALLIGAVRVGTQHPVDAVASVVTTSTGLSGAKAIGDLVEGITGSAWPFAAAVAGLLILAGGVFTLVTAHRWRAGGRRYEREGASEHVSAGARPHDATRDRAIDSWDDLSHGDDPTAR
ncbi:Trp biosynthesis-associated membrane protein [Microbacterium flavum]|uniref:Trp biosynthesis-associated membrane protein n=1 Tax=Microbacterium flavum TaxID=415216 RepID=A0ABS5XXC0_9MICO|nr:Trp biosynthesis-associated membrane protein [Microbacterium flavum]MBT8798591.1 Trp biosynthesis-associated membrane protein [Microbacterium flavum]